MTRSQMYQNSKTPVKNRLDILKVTILYSIRRYKNRFAKILDKSTILFYILETKVEN
jgi:hypothetical protein